MGLRSQRHHQRLRALCVLWAALAVACSADGKGTFNPGTGSLGPNDNPQLGDGLTGARFALSLSSPTSEETNVAVGAGLTFEFTAPADPSSFTVTTDSTARLSAPSWTNGNRTASVLPATPFPAGTAINVALTARSAEGVTLEPTTLRFTTAGDGSNAPLRPSVVSTVPNDGSTGVSVSSGLAIRFSQAMRQDSVSITLTPNVPIGAGTWSDGDRVVTFATVNFAATTSYTLAAAGQSLAGQPLTGSTSVRFVTGAAPAAGEAPVVSGATPVPSDTGVPRETGLTLAFTKPMDMTSVQNAFIRPSGLNGTFNWNSQATIMTFQPSGVLSYGTTVTWGVGAAARDALGVPLAQEFTASFRVVRSATIDLPSIAAMDGWVNTQGVVNAGAVDLIVGDGPGNGQNVTFRSFLTFDLSQLSPAPSRITEATFFVRQTRFIERPYTFLGVLQAHSVNYGASLDGTDWGIAPLNNDVRTVTNLQTVGTLTLNATTKVSDDWNNREGRASRSQFRLQMSADFQNRDQFPDQAFLNAAEAAADRPTLRVTFEYR